MLQGSLSETKYEHWPQRINSYIYIHTGHKGLNIHWPLGVNQVCTMMQDTKNQNAFQYPCPLTSPHEFNSAGTKPSIQVHMYSVPAVRLHSMLSAQALSVGHSWPRSSPETTTTHLCREETRNHSHVSLPNWWNQCK